MSGPYRTYKDDNETEAWHKRINWLKFTGFCIAVVLFGVGSGASYWSCVDSNAHDLQKMKLDQEFANGTCVEITIRPFNKDEVRCPNKLHKLSWKDHWVVCTCTCITCYPPEQKEK